MHSTTKKSRLVYQLRRFHGKHMHLSGITIVSIMHIRRVAWWRETSRKDVCVTGIRDSKKLHAFCWTFASISAESALVPFSSVLSRLAALAFFSLGKINVTKSGGFFFVAFQFPLSVVLVLARCGCDKKRCRLPRQNSLNVDLIHIAGVSICTQQAQKIVVFHEYGDICCVDEKTSNNNNNNNNKCLRIA